MFDHPRDHCGDAEDRPTRTQIGERRMSYRMDPCGPNGRYINGGNHYANASTIEDARTYARNVLTNGLMGYTLDSVEIVGQLMEFYGPAWRPVTGPEARYMREVIRPQLSPAHCRPQM